MEPTWVESSIANVVRGHIPLEPGASPPNNASGLESGWEQDFIWSEEPKGQKEKQKRQPGGQGGDYGSPTFMVRINHLKLSSNPSKQTILEGDPADGANGEDSEKARTRKVVNIPPFTFDAC
jgi:hypothetical protein